MRRKKIDKQAWPSWLEPLRPNDSSRFRMRTEILRRAAPLFESRRLPWQQVAADWSHMLLPIAAAMVLFFAGLAYEASRPEPAGPPLTLEELIQPADLDDSFSLLTAGTDPSTDHVLSLVMNYER